MIICHKYIFYFISVIAPIAEEGKLRFNKSLKVVKRGNASGETTGVLFDKIISVKIGFQMESEPSYIFQNCYSIKDEQRDSPFFKIGDSGSGVFVIDKENQSLAALGIAFARGEYNRITYVCKIKHISDEFNLIVHAVGLSKDLFNNNNNLKQTSDRNEEPMETS